MKHRISAPRRRAAVIVGGAVAGVLLSGTAAVAYWSITGTGSGTAQSGTMIAPTVSAGTPSGTALFPGLTANGTSTGGNLVVNASNPNSFAVTVTVASSTSATGCTTPAVSFIGGTFTLPANSPSVPRTIANSVSMGTTASNDCQDAAITVSLTTSSTSN
jgi:hypothetical protein